MIAKGVILAYKEVGITIPVVCRIRGTNEKEGQRLIAESGLPIEPFVDFEEAARRVIELADQGTAAKRGKEDHLSTFSSMTPENYQDIHSRRTNATKL